MSVVKITNKIALITVALLMYWVFIFISSTVFGFKTFGENMTELFLLSILGIFSILSGSIILNIMYNLTAIAQRGDGVQIKNHSGKIIGALFFVSLVVIFILLYAGDVATAKKKEEFLVSSAVDLIEEKSDIVGRLADYSFTREYIQRTSDDIKLLSKVEEKFPNITVITNDTVDSKPFLLRFNSYSRLSDDKKVSKVDYILSTSSEERKYLFSVFNEDVVEHRFSSNNGQYEIYFPVNTDKGKIVLYLSQRNRYGKIGS